MNKSLSISVSSTINSATILQKAMLLADKLGLSYCPSISQTDSTYILAYTDAGLQLLRSSANADKKHLLFVDFVAGKNGYRHAKNLTVRQPLARAVGIKSGARPSIFDATAGLGGDGFVLACLGCTVSMCERSPILHSLLEDGLNRAKEQTKTKDIVVNRIKLMLGDSMHILQHNDNQFDTIYLDPMYPHRTKSALNKQEMRVIRELVGDDIDDAKLLDIALSATRKRVVVKRPKGAKELSDRSPSHIISTKNSRYDVYMGSG